MRPGVRGEHRTPGADRASNGSQLDSGAARLDTDDGAPLVESHSDPNRLAREAERELRRVHGRCAWRQERAREQRARDLALYLVTIETAPVVDPEPARGVERGVEIVGLALVERDVELAGPLELGVDPALGEEALHLVEVGARDPRQAPRLLGTEVRDRERV